MGELNLSGWDIVVTLAISVLAAFVAQRLQKAYGDKFKQRVQSTWEAMAPYLTLVVLFLGAALLQSVLLASKSGSNQTEIACVESCSELDRSKIALCHHEARAAGRQVSRRSVGEREADSYFEACVAALDFTLKRTDCRSNLDASKVCIRLPSLSVMADR